MVTFKYCREKEKKTQRKKIDEISAKRAVGSLYHQISIFRAGTLLQHEDNHEALNLFTESLKDNSTLDY